METGLLCGRCGTPICPRCLVQTPVGARCRTCANVRLLPTIDVSPLFLARGAAAAVAAGVVSGAAWGFLVGGSRAGLGGFFIIFLALGLGWAVGEAVSVATNRKRSPVLQACAVAGVIIAYFVHNAVAGDALLARGDLWGYIATGFAAMYAASRLRA